MISAVEMPTMLPRASVYPSLQGAPSSQKEAARCSSGPWGLAQLIPPSSQPPVTGFFPPPPSLHPHGEAALNVLLVRILSVSGFSRPGLCWA